MCLFTLAFHQQGCLELARHVLLDSETVADFEERKGVGNYVLEWQGKKKEKRKKKGQGQISARDNNELAQQQADRGLSINTQAITTEKCRKAKEYREKLVCTAAKMLAQLNMEDNPTYVIYLGNSMIVCGSQKPLSPWSDCRCDSGRLGGVRKDSLTTKFVRKGRESESVSAIQP